MGTNYYIKDLTGNILDVSELTVFKQFVLTTEMIFEHFKAQDVAKKLKNIPDSEIQLVFLGVENDVYDRFKWEITEKYPDNIFDFGNEIVVSTTGEWDEVLKIINTDLIDE